MTAIIRNSWETNKWSVTDTDFTTYDEEFDTERQALEFAKSRGYEWAYVPSAQIARPVDLLLKEK